MRLRRDSHPLNGSLALSVAGGPGHDATPTLLANKCGGWALVRGGAADVAHYSFPIFALLKTCTFDNVLNCTGITGLCMSVQQEDSSSAFITIREVGDEFGLTLRTLRFYEEVGLITPTRNGRQRLFAQADVERLRLVLKLKAFGFSLSEITKTIRKPGIGPYGLTSELCEEMIDRLTQQKLEIEAALAELRRMVG